MQNIKTNMKFVFVHFIIQFPVQRKNKKETEKKKKQNEEELKISKIKPH